MSGSHSRSRARAGALGSVATGAVAVAVVIAVGTAHVCGMGVGGATAAPVVAPPAPAPSAPAPSAPGPPAPTASTVRGRYSWPLQPTPRVVRPFAPPARRWLAGHRGVDLAAPAGAVVRSAGAGVVNFAGRVAGKPVVSVRHPDGIVTTYEPVAATVTAGDHVIRGSPLGTVVAGHPGCAASCLHWGARRGSGSRATYLDPRALVGPVRVRLKPLEGSASGRVTSQP